MTRKRKDGKRPVPRGNQRQRLERELTRYGAPALRAPEKLILDLTPPQDAFLSSPAATKGFVAGRGAGKTTAGALNLLIRAMEVDDGLPRLYAAYSPTYSMMRDVALRAILDWGEQLRCILQVNHSDLRIRLSNGSEIICRSAEPLDRVRGLNLSGVWLDEASYMDERFYLALIGALREHGERGWLAATFTPRGKVHWTYKRFVEREAFSLVHAATSSNVFLPPQYEAELRDQYPSSFAKQELDGLFIDTEGALFKAEWFGPESIADAAPLSLIRWVRYWDLAASLRTTGDYTASIAGAMDEQGVLWLRDMVRGKWEWPEQRAIMARTMLAERDITAEQGIEQALHGLAALQDLSRDPSLMGVPIRGIVVDKDKLSRALPVAALAERGKIRLVRGPWIQSMIDELTTFGTDNSEHDDQVDAVSGVYRMLSGLRSRRLITW